MEKKVNKFTRALLLSAGILSVGLGILGIFLPLLPTTPFLLLAAACFARSSSKFYNRLLANKILGKYISGYRSGNGIPLKIKVFSISLLWITILLSAFLVVENLYVQIVLLLIATAVSIHIVAIRKRK
ncbi:MAG: YbaN family protein [Bacteroidota bacterium]